MNNFNLFNTYTGTYSESYSDVFKLHKRDVPPAESLSPYHPYRYISNGNIYAHALKIYANQSSKRTEESTVDLTQKIEGSISSSNTRIYTPSNSGGGTIQMNKDELSLGNLRINSSGDITWIDSQPEPIVRFEQEPNGAITKIHLDMSKVASQELKDGIMTFDIRQ